mgnify:CR=1 FL=1
MVGVDYDSEPRQVLEVLQRFNHPLTIITKSNLITRDADILGEMGQTGNATGVHLHYEVRLAGKSVNPQPYLKLQRQWLQDL